MNENTHSYFSVFTSLELKAFTRIPLSLLYAMSGRPSIFKKEYIEATMELSPEQFMNKQKTSYASKEFPLVAKPTTRLSKAKIKLLLLYLSMPINNKGIVPRLSFRQVAKKIGVHVNHVKKCNQSLEEEGYIHTIIGDKGHTFSVYIPSYHQMNDYLEQQSKQQTDNSEEKAFDKRIGFYYTVPSTLVEQALNEKNVNVLRLVCNVLLSESTEKHKDTNFLQATHLTKRDLQQLFPSYLGHPLAWKELVNQTKRYFKTVTVEAEDVFFFEFELHQLQNASIMKPIVLKNEQEKVIEQRDTLESCSRKDITPETIRQVAELVLEYGRTRMKKAVELMERYANAVRPVDDVTAFLRYTLQRLTYAIG